MSMHKYIYWHNQPDSIMTKKDGKRWANVHLLIGYNQGTIVDFQKMAAILRETFPEAKDEDIKCGKVWASSYVNSFSIISWNVHLDEGSYDGWIQYGRTGQKYKIEYSYQ